MPNNCSSFCDPAEPCLLTGDGVCAETRKQPALLRQSYRLDIRWEAPPAGVELELTPDDLIEYLNDAARFRISRMLANGFTAGELLYCSDDSSLELRGWWETKLIDPDAE